LEAVNWVVDDEEHVQSLQLPHNVKHTPEGVSLVDLFERGELDAAQGGAAGIGRSGAPTANWEAKPIESYPLINDAEEAERDWFKRTQIYPTHGVLAMKSELVEQEPWIAKSLFDAFVAAKVEFLEQLPDLSYDDGEFRRYRHNQHIVEGDPLPYGLEVNRNSFEAMARYSYEQHLLERIPDLEEIFVVVD
jgi:4,5-dihydroxyphthalate decarboxylase